MRWWRGDGEGGPVALLLWVRRGIEEDGDGDERWIWFMVGRMKVIVKLKRGRGWWVKVMLGRWIAWRGDRGLMEGLGIWVIDVVRMEDDWRGVVMMLFKVWWREWRGQDEMKEGGDARRLMMMIYIWCAMGLGWWWRGPLFFFMVRMKMIYGDGERRGGVGS